MGSEMCIRDSSTALEMAFDNLDKSVTSPLFKPIEMCCPNPNTLICILLLSTDWPIKHAILLLPMSKPTWILLLL